MEPRDPTTGRTLPSDVIQRVLFVANNVHVYKVPPLTSMQGYSASSWTEDPARHIFTARLRVVETSLEDTEDNPPPFESGAATAGVKIDLVLEDPSSGQLFAAAPYGAKSDVEPVVDSTRFFALTVRDEQGRKAILGIGFEERSEAFDLNLSLQEAARSLGLDGESNKHQALANHDKKQETKDYSLKEGETITVNLGGRGKFGRRKAQLQADSPAAATSSSPFSGTANLQSFALSPPPPAPAPASAPLSGSSALPSSASGGFALPPPPKTSELRHKRRSLANMGFDDGKFGEFA